MASSDPPRPGSCESAEAADEKLERCLVFDSGREVCVGHSQFVKVGQERRV